MPLGFPKPESRRREKGRKDRAEAKVIKAVRRQVFSRDSACRICQGTRSSGCYDQMHEDPPRSATRGMAPEARFNTRVCCRVCISCHQDLTEHRRRIRFADLATGFDGRIAVE